MTDPTLTNCITFNSRPTEEVLRLDKEGFHYKGQFIADAGEAHRLMMEFLKSNSLHAANNAHELMSEMLQCMDQDAELVAFNDAITSAKIEGPWRQTVRERARAYLAQHPVDIFTIMARCRVYNDGIEMTNG